MWRGLGGEGTVGGCRFESDRHNMSGAGFLERQWSLPHFAAPCPRSIFLPAGAKPTPAATDRRNLVASRKEPVWLRSKLQGIQALPQASSVASLKRDQAVAKQLGLTEKEGPWVRREEVLRLR